MTLEDALAANPVEGPKIIDERPPSGPVLLLNTVCHNRCPGQQFRIGRELTIICVHCDTPQKCDENRGAVYWAGRRWKLAS